MSEILGALFKYLLALVGIAAVVVVLYEALSGNKTSTAVSNISQIQANIAQLYAGDNNAKDQLATPTALIGAGVIPASMVSGQTIVDPWGQQDTVPTPTAPAVAAIVFTAVPNSACAKLVAAILPIVSSVVINSSTTALTSATAGVSDIATACGTSASSGGSSTTMPIQVNFSGNGSN